MIVANLLFMPFFFAVRIGAVVLVARFERSPHFLNAIVNIIGDVGAFAES